MRQTKLVFVFLLILLAVPLAQSTVTLTQGTEVAPNSSNTTYEMAKDIKFSQITVYSDKVNFSTTNVSTESTDQVMTTIWKHNSSIPEYLYHYNDTATTNFTTFNSSTRYEIKYDGVQQRVVENTDFINVTVPSNTNLSINPLNNNAPDKPSNPSPTNGLTDTDYDVSLSVDVSDPDGNIMNVSFYDNSDDSLIGFESDISSGGTASTTWNNLNSGSTYSWYAVADDSYDQKTSDVWSFTTNNPVKLLSNSQLYTNFSVNHEFYVESYANNTDGESDISCSIFYSEPDGNTGLISGNLDTSYGNSEEFKCGKNISTSLTGVEVGERITTSVRFNDGQGWANTSNSQNVVPNNPPTKPSTFTDLGGFLTSHTPQITWSGEDDPDNDPITIKAYTNQSNPPNSLDNQTTGSTLKLGKNITLLDNNTYYYRLQACDNYGACSSFTSTDKFRMNQEPKITDFDTNSSNIFLGDELELRANLTDQNLISANFTVWEGNNKLIDSQNGSLKSNTWISPIFSADSSTTYNYTIKAYDNVSEMSKANGSFSTNYKTQGKYVKTLKTTENVTEVKPQVYGKNNGGSIIIKANTSGNTPEQLDNNSWKTIDSGKNLSIIFQITGDGGSSPSLNSYNLSYRTDYRSTGIYKSKTKNFSQQTDLVDVKISESQPSGTNITYEFRGGNTSSTPSTWSDWNLCNNNCDPGLRNYQFYQFRANLTGKSSETPQLSYYEAEYK